MAIYVYGKILYFLSRYKLIYSILEYVSVYTVIIYSKNSSDQLIQFLSNAPT